MSLPLRNHVLCMLSEKTLHALEPHLKPVPVRVGQMLYERGRQPLYAHFLTSGLASVITCMSDGGGTEVATIGREGVPQALHVIGAAHVPTECTMQLGGTALRMPMGTLVSLAEQHTDLFRALAHSVQYHATLLAQLSGCNRLHLATPRLASLLLMMRDRTGEQSYKLSQRFLGSMLGSRRATVNAAVAELVTSGAIEWRRNSVQLTDTTALRAACCECYGVSARLLEEMMRLPGTNGRARDAERSS